MFSVKEKNLYLCIWFGIYIDRKKAELSGCSAVGSVLRSGRRGRQFESGHPDPIYNKRCLKINQTPFFILITKLQAFFSALLDMIFHGWQPRG